MLTILMLLIQFIVIPLLTGSLLNLRFSKIIDSRLSLVFIYGYLAELTIYTIIGMICSVFEIRYHIMKTCFLVSIFLVVVLYFLVCLIKHKLVLLTIKKESLKLKKEDYIFLLLFLGMSVYQIIVLIYSNGDKIVNDDSVYLPMINDTLYSDRIYHIQQISGELLTSVWDNGIKYVGLPWFAILAFYADIFDVNVIFLYRTIFPIFTLLLFYITMWVISGFFWQKVGNRLMYMFIISILISNEATELMRGSSWGKILVEYVGVIILTYTMFKLVYGNIKDFWYGLLIMIITFPGVGMTTMTVMLYSLILFVWLVIFVIRNKNYRIIPIVVIGMIPILLQAMIIVAAEYIV